MARDLTAGFITEIEADTLRPAILLKAEFASGDVRGWTGDRDLTYNSETYTGLGYFIGISAISETQALQANGVQVSLSGIPSSLIAIALDATEYSWKPISIYFSVLDQNYNLINNPSLAFSGKMDVLEINDSGHDFSSITVNCEDNMIDVKQSRERFYTPEDQKRKFPNDKGLDFIPTLQDKELKWGAS